MRFGGTTILALLLTACGAEDAPQPAARTHVAVPESPRAEVAAPAPAPTRPRVRVELAPLPHPDSDIPPCLPTLTPEEVEQVAKGGSVPPTLR